MSRVAYAGEPFAVDEVELRVVEVPLRHPFASAVHVTTHKVAVIVIVRSDGVEGLGEGVMEPLPWFREETVGGALTVLRGALVPELLANGCTSPAELTPRWAAVRGNPMAKAALEMAVWDLAARRAGMPLWELLGGDGEPVQVGAALGRAGDPGELVENVAAHVEQGYRRVKIKVARGGEAAALAAVRERFPDIHLSVDANCSYTLADVPMMAALDPFGLEYIEQPLHWDDLIDHAVLASQLATPICLDESLSSPARVAAALDLRACSVVNVKAGRLGGLASVQQVVEICTAAQIPMWCGGMLELGIGRAHNLHLATMPGFDLPGDTASASRTYVTDIVNEALEAHDGTMPVPSGPGIGVTMNRPFLDSVTVSTERFRRATS